MGCMGSLAGWRNGLSHAPEVFPHRHHAHAHGLQRIEAGANHPDKDKVDWEPNEHQVLLQGLQLLDKAQQLTDLNKHNRQRALKEQQC